jgi:hypothetical protein
VALDFMMTRGSDVVFGGDIALTIPLFGNGLINLVSAVYSPSRFEVVVGVAVGLWLLVLAHWFPLGRPFWHHATLVTFALLGLLSLGSLTLGVGSFFTYVWIVWCGGAVLYLAITARRKRRIHEV